MAGIKIRGALILRSSAYKLLKPVSSLIASERTAYWNRDWKPSPRRPATAEEHAAAAAKYGLIPADYRPLPDDGYGRGDYPDLPVVSAEARDPYYNWDMPEMKRDFGEPMHFSADMYTENRYNANRHPRISIPQMWAAFLSIMIGYTIVFIYFDNKKMFRPVMPKQFARGGTHYTFELKE